MKSFSLGLAANPWIVAAVIAAAFAFAVYSYRRTSPPVRPLRRWTLITLRTLGIALLLFVLFEPVLTALGLGAEDPVVLVAVDNSQSMTLGGQDSSRIAEARAIAGRVERSALGGRSRFVSFSDSLLPMDVPIARGRLDARGGETRLETPFTAVADSLRVRNVRAIVLLSDGRYNAGANPLFAAEGLGIPVFAVGLGDSVPPRDLSLQQIFTNEVTYVGSELPVEVRARSSGFEQGTATITLRDENGVVGSQQVSLASGTSEYMANFTYKARAEGIAKLRAEISVAPGELTAKNNGRVAFVKVKSNKRRYVLVAGGPNPDVAFIRRILSSDPNVVTQSFIQKGGPEFIEGKLEPGTFRDAEAVVLVDFPTANSSEEALRLIGTVVAARNLPLLVVMGANTDVARMKRLENLLPVTLGGARGDELQTFTDLTEAGRNSPITRVPRMEAWKSLPPIYRSETSAFAKPESEVLARARLGNTTLEEPMIVSRRLGRSRSLMVLGYGIYRWQLLGEGPGSAHGDEGAGILRDVLGNALRWLAAGDEEKQVRIVTNKQLFSLGEPVRFQAQVHDESFNPLSDATVAATAIGPAGRYQLTLAPTGNGRYESTLGTLPAGDYSFTGRATAAGAEIGSDGGRFTIGDVGVEFQEPTMNVELMRALAARTGGRFYTARTSNSLIEDIAAHKGFAPRSIESRSDTPLWQNPWLLAIALAAFAIEWFIRKRSGMV